MKSAFGMMGLLAAACATPQPGTIFISERARAAIPPGTDVNDVRRLENGCYVVVVEGDLSGVIRPLKDIRGERICDDVVAPGGYRGA